jgi:hypothetical protein
MNTKLNFVAGECSLDPLVRKIFVTRRSGHWTTDDSEKWEDPALFHRWAQSPRCAVGDGSCVGWETVALIETHDGTVEYVEPWNIRFANTDSATVG